MASFPGFVGGAYQAPSIYQDAQECINWYPEVDPTKPPEARGAIALYPTPGRVTLFTLAAAAEIREMYVLPGNTQMLVISGGYVYIVSSLFVATQVGTLATTSGRAYASDNRIAVMIVDGLNRYSYIIATGVFSTISTSDGGFVGGQRVDYVDTFLIYNQPGTNLWGCTSPLSTASSNLSFSSKDSSSDNLVTIIADHREVLVIGERTTERWVNVGAFPFPFQRIPGTSMQHGCAAKDSVARLGESVAWLARDSRGTAVVIQMSGYIPKRISTHAVETDIASGTISDAIALTYQQGGHEFYQLTFPSQDKTWRYDLTTEIWHKGASRDNLNILHRCPENCYAFFQGLSLVGDSSNGKIYQLDQNTYTDDGKQILRMRRTPHMTEGLDRVFYESLQIQFQPGVGLATGQGSDPQMMLRWSDDGASTWSSYYQIAIGKTGQFKNRAIKRKMGWARDRVYEVTITDPVKAVIISAEIETSKGDS